MSITLYGAHIQLTHEHQPVLAMEVAPSPLRARRLIFIRAVITAEDVELALDNARPLPGEIVLNVMPLSRA